MASAPICFGGATMELHVGLEGVFEGVYQLHWEVTDFQVKTVEHDGITENPTGWCTSELVLSEGMKEPWFERWNGELPPNWRQRDAMWFNMRFVGRVIEQGHFGHMGTCRWRIEVHELLACEEQEEKAPEEKGWFTNLFWWRRPR